MTKLNSIGIAKDPKDTLVIVAMSGGVDSSTVAAMMKNEGYNVIGITLKLYNDSKETASSKQCCAGQDIMDAKRVADKLKIEHKILYYQNKFKEGVIEISRSFLKSMKNKPKVCLTPREIKTTTQAAISVIKAVLFLINFSELILYI